MTRFVVGEDRSQSTLFPERLEDYLSEDNPVRAIDVFVDELDLAKLGFVADRGYYSGEEIVACEQAGITVYLPKPMTSGLLAKGRFGKQDFVYVAADDVYLCPSGEKLTYHYTNEEDGKTVRRYWTNACQGCAMKDQCTTGKERRISRWEHEAVLEAVQARLDWNPGKMRVRRQTVEHPFGTIKSWMGATHFQMKTLKHVSTEMALHVLAYNMKRVISILGVGGLMEAIRA
jgi:Transposase DDE domain